MGSSSGFNYSANVGLSPAVSAILSIVIAALSVIAYWKIFEKAGEPGWAAIVPGYNLYTLFKITWGNGWNLFLLLIPIYGWIIVPIITMIKLGKAFKKSTGFIVGLVLLVLIFDMILAFNGDQYTGVPEPAKKA